MTTVEEVSTPSKLLEWHSGKEKTNYRINEISFHSMQIQFSKDLLALQLVQSKDSCQAWVCDLRILHLVALEEMIPDTQTRTATIMTKRAEMTSLQAQA